MVKRFFLGIKTITLLLGILVIAGMVFASKVEAAGNRVIVVLDSTESLPAERAAVLEQGCTVVRELSIVPAIVVHLPEQAADQAKEAILRHALVVRIEDDSIVNASAKPGGGKPPKPQPDQTLPWGIDRIDADLAWSNSTGLGVKVAILDTGIDTTHPDLVNNICGGINIIDSRKLYTDDNGHGTHVAGIVAATYNTIGVIGAAHRASLYGVKVLGRSGSGWNSDIIAGLEWCVNNGMDVINMSFGGSDDSQALHDAITVVNNAGIVQVAAAGNEGGPVCYPAKYPEVIAVAATDSGDNIPYWSNSGAEIDLAAPGVSINSTYKGEVYKVLSGTSMASPHVAAVAALILENQPSYTPDQVLDVLRSTADDLGLSSLQQGAGLVDAQEAVLITEP